MRAILLQFLMTHLVILCNSDDWPREMMIVEQIKNLNSLENS